MTHWRAYRTEVRIPIITWGHTADEARERVRTVRALISLYDDGGDADGDINRMIGIAEHDGATPTGPTRRWPARDFDDDEDY